jgi:hypothetical protein
MTKKFIGLHNICTDKKHWYHLLFYDFDDKVNNIDKQQIDFIKSQMNGESYILYSTKHGLNLIGLTPLSVTQWASEFYTMQVYFPNYYAGHTIRLSRKKQEIQTLIAYNSKDKAVTPLCTIFEKRFNIKFPNTIKMKSVFEWYGSRNQ